jgi:succinyl-CoA synthetase beta subunit
LTGTNEELGIEILQKAGFEALTDMDEAVQQAVKIAQEAA